MPESSQRIKSLQSKPSKFGRWISWFFVILLFIFTILLLFKQGIFTRSQHLMNQYYEPVFKKEGVLSFYDADHQKLIRSIDIEITDNEQERLNGLMYRTKMSDSTGMLFIMPRYEKQSFWMKNTYISLDIIFADRDKKIVKIQKYTVPLSEGPIPSIRKSLYVVEVVAGFCDKYGIEENDYITFSRTDERRSLRNIPAEDEHKLAKR